MFLVNKSNSGRLIGLPIVLSLLPAANVHQQWKITPILATYSTKRSVVCSSQTIGRRFLAMQAIRVHEFGGEDKLKFEDDVIVPELQENKVLIRVHAAGVNPVDTYIRQGTYSRVPQLPYIPGVDGAGIVEEVGDNVTTFKVGDRVIFSRNHTGSYAQFSLADENCCWPLPSHLTFEQGASVPVPYFTAYRALFQKADAKAGQIVLVHGASGAVGLAACQLAKNHNLIVFGTAGTEEGMQLVKNNGLADQVFNHKEKHYMNEILTKTPNGRGVDIILEMLANVNLGHDLPILNEKGTVLVIGSRGQVKIDPRDLMGKESRIFGVALFKSNEDEWLQNSTAVLSGLKNKTLNPVVGHVYNLNEAARAHHDIIQNKGTKGKLVLKID